MKNFLVSLAVLGLNACASSGRFVDRSVFNDTPYVIAEGKSRAQASANARAFVPAAFQIDENGMRASSCVDSSEIPVWNPKVQDYVCPSGRYQSALAVLPRDPKSRAEITTFQSAMSGQTKYSATGIDSRDALRNLLKKLPSHAVIDSYSLGCTQDINIDPATGHASCANNPKGNLREATTFVIEPNATKIIKIE